MAPQVESEPATRCLWAAGFYFREMELSLELWDVIAEVYGFDTWREKRATHP